MRTGTEPDDGLLVCYSCGKILGYLLGKESGTERVYLANRLEQHGKVNICRHCRAVQWGYPEQKKELVAAE